MTAPGTIVQERVSADSLAPAGHVPDDKPFWATAPADIAEPELAANARTVLARRYLKKGADGEPAEEPRDLFWRVAGVIAHRDSYYGADDDEVRELAHRFYHLVATGLFEPNSPTFMNAGRPLGQLSACFVLPVPDSLAGIYETLRDMALIHQSGGGTGFGFSHLRPAGDVVKSTMGVASGPVSFMEVYDASTEAVKQGGTRRGANMGILRVDHPDIRRFVKCKSDKNKITNFNISVAITDAFMSAVRAGDSYDLVNPRTGQVTDRLDAAEVFSELVSSAWRNGEPGVFYIDEANRYNPVPHLGGYVATNPCGEQPLLPYDVCNLGSLNVGRFVTAEGKVDWDRLGEVVRDATHFLDNVIDANQYPLEQIDDLAKRIRRIGLGIMGWADMLVKVGQPYGSPASIELARELMRFVDEQSKVASERLASERGVFPEWERSIWGPDETCARDDDGERIRSERRLRNCNLTTIAPTGTISIIAGCSGGIEPLFSVSFTRNQAGVLMTDFNPEFVRRAKRGGWYSEELMNRIDKEGHIHFDEVPGEVQGIFVTAHDVTPEQHVRMQAAFQEHCDSGISKTCNFPAEATEDDVRKIYELAYGLGCKGVTVYRDGSRDEQVLSTGKTARDVRHRAGEGDAGQAGVAAGNGAFATADIRTLEARDVGSTGEATDELLARLNEAEALNRDFRARNHALEEEVERRTRSIAELEGSKMARVARRRRPNVLRGHTRHIKSPLGTMYVTINEDSDGRPFEVFVALGKTGGAAMADAEAIGRLCSLALRSGIALKDIYKQLRGISSDRPLGLGANSVLSGPDAVAHVIKKYLEEKEGVQQSLDLEPKDRLFIGACTECGSSLAYQEGCATCYACGYSECG